MESKLTINMLIDIDLKRNSQHLPLAQLLFHQRLIIEMV